MKTKYVYIAYDNTKFDDFAEGLVYDLNAFSTVNNEVWFFCYDGYESFELIPTDKYIDWIPNMQIYHVRDILSVRDIMKKAAVMYCHTPRAAEVINGFMCNKDEKENKTMKIKSGYSFLHADGEVETLLDLDISIKTNEDFAHAFHAMRNFIKRNLED